jgi:glutamate racemase
MIQGSCDNRPIGLFDSGVGGLSVVRHLRRRLPAESLLYIADNAFAPYGERPPEQVEERALAIGDYLVRQGVKAIVVACNTATAAAIDPLRQRLALPIIGMEPGVKPAVAASRNGRVGVLATSGTINSDKFAALIDNHRDSADIRLQPCPGLVERVERGELDGEAVAHLLESFLRPLREQRIDTLALGCTHYPLLMTAIRRNFPNDVTIIDTGEAVVRHLENTLAASGMLAEEGAEASASFFATDQRAYSKTLFTTLLGEECRLGQIAIDTACGEPLPATG